MKVHVPALAQIGGGRRGAIRDFSQQSRKRFLESFAKARDMSGGVHVTLTYPAAWPDDWRAWKTHLDVFLKRLARRHPRARGWWRLELQQRGAPHYHLLIFGCAWNARQWRRWLPVAWYQIVGSGDLRHLHAGTRCDVIKNRRHAMAYLSKYAAKLPVNAYAKPQGRLWGHFGTIDQSPAKVIVLAPWQVMEVRRALVRWLHSRASRFERRLARCPASRGWAVFGAGDQSQELSVPGTLCTIFRMVEPFLSG